MYNIPIASGTPDVEKPEVREVPVVRSGGTPPARPQPPPTETQPTTRVDATVVGHVKPGEHCIEHRSWKCDHKITSDTRPWLVPHHFIGEPGYPQLCQICGCVEFAETTKHIRISELSPHPFEPCAGYNSLCQKCGKPQWKHTIGHRYVKSDTSEHCVICGVSLINHPQNMLSPHDMRSPDPATQVEEVAVDTNFCIFPAGGSWCRVHRSWECAVDFDKTHGRSGHSKVTGAEGPGAVAETAPMALPKPKADHPFKVIEGGLVTYQHLCMTCGGTKEFHPDIAPAMS